MQAKICSYSTCKLAGKLQLIDKFYKQAEGLYGVRAECKECTKNYNGSTPEKRLLQSKRSRKWSKENPEKVSQYRDTYKTNHPEKAAIYKAERRASKLQATPPWTTEKMKTEIKFFYWLAKTMTKTFGVKHAVDHIYPLKGKNSRGLHVPWNLQVITEIANRSKGNKVAN